jgi:hypothetical protein
MAEAEGINMPHAGNCDADREVSDQEAKSRAESDVRAKGEAQSMWRWSKDHVSLKTSK